MYMTANIKAKSQLNTRQARFAWVKAKDMQHIPENDAVLLYLEASELWLPSQEMLLMLRSVH